jgi:hypothetical protein
MPRPFKANPPFRPGKNGLRRIRTTSPETDAMRNRGQIAILAVLIALLILVIIWAVSVWTSSAGVEMGKHGWIALFLGTFFSLVIGCGLMALMFFSSRSGYDEVADPLRHAHEQDEAAKRDDHPSDRT